MQVLVELKPYHLNHFGKRGKHMEPIYDRSGKVVAWLNEGRILDQSNKYSGFLHNDALYSMNGHYLGQFRSGFFRDRSGGAVAFIKGASGGPVIPATQIPPINPIPPVAPVAPIGLIGWGLDWDDLFTK